MSFADKKIEISMIGLVGVMVFGLGHIFSSHRAPAMNQEDINYEMPRPKAAYTDSEFDLNGREIDRDYVNPFADKKKKETDKKAVAAKKAAADAAAKVAKQKEEAKKKAAEEAKKKSATKVAKKDVTEAQNTAAADNFGLNTPNPQAGAGAPAEPEAKAAAAAAANNSDNRSSAQWIALISADPTQANVAALIKAYQAGQVDEETVDEIISDLLKSSKDSSQSLGMYALQSIYDAKSFELIVTDSAQLDSTNQAAANTYIASYSSHLSALAGVLESSNDVMISKATTIILSSYGSVTTTSKGSTSTNTAAYAQFISIYTNLAKSSDPTVAALAKSALSQLQASTVAANQYYRDMYYH